METNENERFTSQKEENIHVNLKIVTEEGSVPSEILDSVCRFLSEEKTNHNIKLPKQSQ